jgi:hypothetical protein
MSAQYPDWLVTCLDIRCDAMADVSVISKFGENEFKSGDKERGRTYFESVLENAVRRVDIWSVYIDMEIKYGDEERTECVLLPLARVKLSAFLISSTAELASLAFLLLVVWQASI